MKDAAFYQRTGLARILYAFKWSYQGLSVAFRTEAAFRQESILLLPLLIVAFCLDISGADKAILLLSTVLVLIIELLNSALEALADRISTDYDIQLGKVKDYGSAAVFLTIASAVGSWGYIILDNFS